uniref:Nurim n=1 Tax=Balaenoptera musculus TaxID=9771 RepID=A0A8C0D3U5_BALMU
MLNMLMVEVGRAAGQPGVGAASGSRSFKGGLLGYPVPHPPSAGDAVLEPVPRGPCCGRLGPSHGPLGCPSSAFVLHVISWLLIFSILLVFDYAELMGLKQVYYHVLGLGEPLALKSPRALRLFSHLRHPVCVELLTVLWVVPTLGTDRLLLALLLTLYLGLAHGLDQQDLRYLRAQLQRKLHLLSRPQDGEAE